MSKGRILLVSHSLTPDRRERGAGVNLSPCQTVSRPSTRGCSPLLRCDSFFCNFTVWLLVYSMKTVSCELSNIPRALISVKISLNLVSKVLCSQIDGSAEITSGGEVFSNSVVIPPYLIKVTEFQIHLKSGDVLSWHRNTLLDSLKLYNKMKH